MTSKTVAALTAENVSSFPDNTTGLVTPALVRGMIQDLIDSYLNLNGVAAPTTITSTTYSVLPADLYLIANFAGTVTLTMPAAISFKGRPIMVKTIQSQTVVSASSNIVPLAGGAAATSILTATAGKWSYLISDGTNWVIMAAN